jgi:hypothetical protein
LVSEANVSIRPDPDLRVAQGKGPESTAYGFLSPKLFQPVRDLFVTRAKMRDIGVVKRTA